MRSLFGYARALCLCMVVWTAQHASAKNITYLPAEELALIKPIYKQASAGEFDAAAEAALRAGLPVVADMVGWMKYRSPGAFRHEDDVKQALKRYRQWPDFNTIQAQIESAENKLKPHVYAALFSTLEPVTPGGRIIAYRMNHAIGRGKASDNRDVFRRGWREFIGDADQERALLNAHGALLTENDLKQKIIMLLDRRAFRGVDVLIHNIRNDKEQARFVLAKDLARGKRNFRQVWDASDRESKKHYLFVLPSVKRDISAGEFSNAYQRFNLMIEAKSYHFRTDEWWKVRSRVAREHFDSQKYDISYDIVSRHFFSRDTKEYPQAEWLAGWLALVFLDKPEAAARHFKNMTETVSTPISKGRAYYWLGRAYLAIGNKEAADRAFEESAQNKATYYGQIALLHTKDSTLSLPYDIPINVDERSRAERSPIIRAAKIWHDLGYRSRYYMFMQHAVKHAASTGERAYIAALPFKVKDIRDAVELGRYAYRETGELLVNAAYPILPKSTRRYSKRPDVVHGIIMQESRFHISARSHAGASGLMQIMPATAREVAGKLGIRGNIVRKLNQPATNVRLGSAYIDTLLQEFSGSRSMALAAYNAGGSRVRNWMKRFGNPLKAHSVKQIINWTEIIPFHETRNYVQRVIENINVYSVLTYRRPLVIKAELFL